MDVGKCHPGESSKGSEDDKWRVKQDKARLGNQTVLKYDQTSSHSGGKVLASDNLQREEHDWDDHDTTKSR